MTDTKKENHRLVVDVKFNHKVTIDQAEGSVMNGLWNYKTTAGFKLIDVKPYMAAVREEEEKLDPRERAEFISDEHAERICMTIAAGYSKGAFPIDPKTQQMVGWYDWLRTQVAQAMIDDPNEEQKP